MYSLNRVVDEDGCRDSPDFIKQDEELDNNRVRFVFNRKLRNLVGRRKLGVAWLILDPIFMSLLYLFVLTVVRASPDPKILFIGVSLFRVFSSSFKSGIGSVSDFSGGIKAERVRTRVITRSMVRFRLFDSTLQGSGVALILLFLDISLFGVTIYVISCVLMGVLTEGIGLNFSLLVKRIPDLHNVMTSYFPLLLFFGSPAFYSMTIIDGLHYRINEFNPFAYFVEGVRYYCSTDSEFLELLNAQTGVVFCLAIILSIWGYMSLERQRWGVSSWS